MKKGAIFLTETLKQPKRRAPRDSQPENSIAVGEHRGYCVHCGARNIVKPQWRTVTCSSCGKKGPVKEKPTKKPPRKSDKTKQERTRKPKRTVEPPKAESESRLGHPANRMIVNTLAAIGVMILLSLVLKAITF